MFFGLTISQKLGKLPKTDRDPLFVDALADAWIIIAADNIMEEDFKVEYTAGWGVGRAFSVYGQPRLSDSWPEELEPSGRVGATIHPSADWFASSRLGYLRTYDGGGVSLHLTIPYQLARHALEDLRRAPGSRVSFGIKREVGNAGTKWGVYSFEIMETEFA